MVTLGSVRKKQKAITEESSWKRRISATTSGTPLEMSAPFSWVPVSQEWIPHTEGFTCIISVNSCWMSVRIARIWRWNSQTFALFFHWHTAASFLIVCSNQYNSSSFSCRGWGISALHYPLCPLCWKADIVWQIFFKQLERNTECNKKKYRTLHKGGLKVGVNSVYSPTLIPF